MEEFPYPITVEGDWLPGHAKTILKNKLHVYFQSKKKSNGGECIVKYDDQCRAATVLFKFEHSRESVLAKENHAITIDKEQVKLRVGPLTERKPEDTSSLPIGATSNQLSGCQESGGPDGVHNDPEPEAGLEQPKEDSLQTRAVVLENVPERTSKDLLGLMVEKICHLTDDDYSLELICQSNTAVVTFNNPNDVGRFLTESRSNKKFNQYNLTGRVLERSCSVRVESLPSQANDELLELYFENCGGTVKSIVTSPEEQAAVVTFLEPEVVETIIKKKHSICKEPVNVYPYYECLGTALYGRDRPTLKLPEPFTESIHPAVTDFLLMRGHASSIIDQMGAHFCRVSMDRAEVQLSPLPTLLKQKGLTSRHIDGWRKNASDAFHNIFSKYAAFECPMSSALWKAVEEDTQVVVKEDVVMGFNASRGLIIAGMAKDVEQLKWKVEEIVQRATSRMQRERDSVSQEMDMSRAMFCVLQQDGLQQNATVSCPELVLTYRRDTNKLVLSGLRNEVLTVINWVLEKKLHLRQKPLKVDTPLLEFLRSVDSEEMSEDLFTSRGISVVYKVENGEVVLTGSTERALADAEKKLKDALTFQSLSVEDQGVLEKPEWQKLNTQLQEIYNSAKKKTVLIKFPTKHRDSLIVAGFLEPVKEVSQNLEDFVEKHTQIKEAIRVKNCAVVKFIQENKSKAWQSFTKASKVDVRFDSRRPRIRLQGERVYVQSAKDLFLKMAATLHADELAINKTGARKYFQEQGSMFVSMMMREHSCVVLLQEDHMLEEEEDDEGGEENFGPLSCEVRMPGGVCITVSKANICLFKADAVVNAANEDLQHIGGVAGALLKAAGPCLQEWSDQYVKAHGRLRPGDAIITDAGNLPCKHVVHTVGPRFSDSDRHTAVNRLKRAVRESLNWAARAKCSSIAIPAISSGIFGFPLDLCTKTIAAEVREYFEYNQSSHSNTNALTEVHLIDNNANTVNSIVQAVKEVFADLNPKTTFPQQTGHQGRGQRGHGHHGYVHRGSSQRGYSHRGYSNHGYGPRGYGPPGGNEHGGNEHHGNEHQGNEHQENRPTRSVSGRTSEESDSLGVLETNTTQEDLKITLRKGNIQDALTDVIVNTIASDLDLSKGAVSKALLQAAGPQLQLEANEVAEVATLNYGEIVVTDGYRLKCEKVFHTVCPQWDNGTGKAEEVLMEIIRDCLKKAEMERLASISFPAIGTGNMSFPRDLVARILQEEVRAFSRKCTPQYLQEVAIVLHPSDNETVKCFIREFRGETQGPSKKGARATSQSPHTKSFGQSSQSSGFFSQVSSPTLGVHCMQVGHLTLQVSSGDITKETSDAIVNSSNNSFSLKSGVSKAILDAAGLSVELECSQIVNAPNFQPHSRMILTSAGQLPCRNIIHVVGQNNPKGIRDTVYSVLQSCEEHKFTSVSLPALGTGQGGASPSAVAHAMIDAVVDFVKKKKGQHLKNVNILIFQTAMVSEFQQSMMRIKKEGVEEEKSLFSKFKDKVVAGLFGVSSTAPSPEEEFVMVGEDFAPAVFQLCGESLQAVNQAKEWITKVIVREQTERRIKNPSIGHFTQKDADELQTLQRELTVSIRLERKGPDSLIHLEGLTRDVFTADGRIRDMIGTVERNETRRREAVLVSGLVEWRYLDRRNNLVPFDIFTNHELEEAFRLKHPVKIKINNEKYEADLTRRMAVRGNSQVELKRIDLKEDTSVSLPSNWDDMKGVDVIQVPLTESSTEYQEVEEEFRKTQLTLNIIKIERVQNSMLWGSYIIKRKYLDRKNNHTNNEKLLFHGTSAKNIDHINRHGFNRSYSGTSTGALYGKGAYFAVDASYSASGYSKPDAQGLMRMYLARVLVGDFTQGAGGMIVPPAKNSGNATDLYDSVTDNPAKPTMFVVFNDVQAYPEYLITFQ